MPNNCFALEEENDTFEGIFDTDGEGHDGGLGTQFLVNFFDGIHKISTENVHFVHESDAGNMVFVGLAPDGFGLGLNPRAGIKNDDAPIENTKRALDLGGKVDVTRSVDNVETMFVFVKRIGKDGGPESGDGGRDDGDSPLALLIHPVHDGVAFVDVTDLIGLAGVEKDPLGSGSLARIDVGNDTDVSDSV